MTDRFCPMVSLLASFTIATTAVTIRRQRGQAEATGSSFFEMEATGLFQGASLFINIPLQSLDPFALQYKQLEGLCDVRKSELKPGLPIWVVSEPRQVPTCKAPEGLYLPGDAE